MIGGQDWSERSDAYAGSALHRSSDTLDALVTLLRPGPGDRCLDIGTGAGHTAARLAERAGEVVGIDPAAGMLAAARKLYGARSNLRFERGTGADSGLSSASFDLVAARHTLHHHPDPVATLREAARLLRPGGRLAIVDEVTPQSAVEAWYHRLESTRDPSHVRAYRLEEWRGMVAAAGLRWVAGDDFGREHIDVGDWIDRLAPTPERAAEVRGLLRSADATARHLFDIRYDDGGEPVGFAMPVGTILAVKEE